MHNRDDTFCAFKTTSAPGPQKADIQSDVAPIYIYGSFPHYNESSYLCASRHWTGRLWARTEGSLGDNNIYLVRTVLENASDSFLLPLFIFLYNSFHK